jgi:anaphase-promoting complex subunit 3
VKNVQEAVQELELLRQQTPKEAAIHKLLGRLYKRRGETALALQHFTIAGDLDPKDLASVKSAIEGVLSRDADASVDM